MNQLQRNRDALQLIEIIGPEFAAHQNEYRPEPLAPSSQQMQRGLAQQVIIPLDTAVQLFLNLIHIFVQQAEYLQSLHSFTRVSRLWLQSSIFTSCGSRPIS